MTKRAGFVIIPFMKQILIILAFMAFAVPSLAGDIEKGAKVYKKCVSCHQIGEGATHRIGPQLNGILGRGIAALADYRYSKAMKKYATQNPKWNEATLTAYLGNPRKVVAGTKMSFAGLRRPQDIANVIAYMKTASR